MKVEGSGDRYVAPPPELQTAFDWLRFNTPLRAGGLQDQPLLLMHRMKIALNTYETVRAWRSAQTLPGDALGKWTGANPKIVKFMEYIWSLQGSFDA
jgi:hypothetical protein